jgi:transcriptional regulator with XRE-family HTH domain
MVETLSRIIASRIIKARESKGWRQTDLAAHTNIPRGVISRYENAQRSAIPPINLMKIADATGVTVDYLLGRADGEGVAERIAKARMLKKMSQAQLAKALGIKTVEVKRYEIPGDRYIDRGRITDIARITGVSVEFLLGED